MPTADERERAGIGCCGNTQRRSYGDDEKRPGSAVRFICYLIVYDHFPLCWGCRCELVLRIELVLDKITRRVPKFGTGTDFSRMR